MAEEMPKNYDPAVNEPAILQKWLCLLYTSPSPRDTR